MKRVWESRWLESVIRLLSIAFWVVAYWAVVLRTNLNEKPLAEITVGEGAALLALLWLAYWTYRTADVDPWRERDGRS